MDILRSKSEDVREQYERQRTELRQAYGGQDRSWAPIETGVLFNPAGTAGQWVRLDVKLCRGDRLPPPPGVAVGGANA